MSSAVQDAALAAAAWECDRHRAALDEAMAEWHALPPVSSDALENDSALRRLTDQILFRFTMLQDAMGNRLVPATLGWLQEPYENWPMRDRLDRLEKIGFIDAERWMAWRKTRNQLSHEYPGAPEWRHAAVLAAIAAAAAMVQTWREWQARLPPPPTPAN